LDDTVIKAPVTGTILDRNVEKGEFVTNGFVGDKGAKGYIVTMADLNDLKVELDISQNDFPKLNAHQRGVITTDAYPDRKYQGIIDEISPEADRSKATVQVKVKVLNPDDYLRPDMNATVNFYNEAKAAAADEQAKRVVVIPRSAVQNGSVFVALNGRAKKLPVMVGGATAQGVTIESGLTGGEDLIVNAPADLKDGERVAAK
jgi:HlyD family secretion protein